MRAAAVQLNATTDKDRNLATAERLDALADVRRRLTARRPQELYG